MVKQIIQNLVAYNPSLPIYTVKDFMTVGLQEHLISVELYQYSSEDVTGLSNKIPSLFVVHGTAKLHEFLTKKEGVEVYLFDKNLSNEESRKVTLNVLQTINDHTEESEEEQDEEPDASNRNDSGESDYDSDINDSSILFIWFIVILSYYPFPFLS